MRQISSRTWYKRVRRLRCACPGDISGQCSAWRQSTRKPWKITNDKLAVLI